MTGNQESASITYVVGLSIISLSVGSVMPHQAYGWGLLGLGLIVLSILIYLHPKSDKEQS